MKKLLMLFSILFFSGLITLSTAQTWTIEQVTDNTEPDLFPFVTRVPNGLTIVYTHGDGDNEAFTATNTSGSWASSRITDNSRSDIGLDIASEPGESDVHIALWWQDTPDQEVSYCAGSPSGWDIVRVTDDAEDDAWPSIELDQDGYAHMAYHKFTGGDLEIFYTNNVTGSWISEQVTDNATGDGYPWLALDSDNNPHIVYTDGFDLLYIQKTASIWTTPEVITDGFNISSFPFLVLDRDDLAHVCYAKDDGVDYEIYYSNNVTGSWQESKVTSNDFDDFAPNLFVDAATKVHIAYLADETTDSEIFYANNVGGVWDIGRVTDNSVDDIAWIGQYFISDSQGHGNIFFWNNSDGDDEIYTARSDVPIVASIEETNPHTNPASINLDQTVFTSVATIRYSVPIAGNVTLKVYDATGSLVKILVDGIQPQGEYSVTWDGTGSHGSRMHSGVYFYQLAVNGLTSSARGILK